MYHASMGLSDEVFGLSGWEQDCDNGYSLSFLLRKLPTGMYLRINEKGYSVNIYGSYDKKYHYLADTPEDAACKLLIELFKQGVLKP